MPHKKKDKLRIAMLGHKRIPSREGGVEMVVAELSTRMVTKGHSVTCYNRKGHHVSGAEYDTKKLREFEGVILKNVFTIDKKGLAAMSSSFFAALKAAFGKYDVVHFHAEGPCAMIWLPKLFRKRCIVTVHGLDHQRAKWGNFASKYILWGEKCAVKYADEIVVLSKNVQKYFLDTYERKTVFIPNGVGFVEKVEAERIKEMYGVDKDEYILYLGRLVPEKGIEYLIEAFNHIKTDKKLIVAGGCSDTAEYENELRSIAASNTNIIFTGFVQGKMLEELYSNAYIYVLPSDIEGMPLSLLEAMSYGNCCLTSNIPECTDVIGKYGEAFEKSNISDLTRKLQMLCEEPDVVAGFKRQAAEYICQNYNWDEIATRTLRLYGADEASVLSDMTEELGIEGVTGK